MDGVRNWPCHYKTSVANTRNEYGRSSSVLPDEGNQARFPGYRATFMARGDRWQGWVTTGIFPISPRPPMPMMAGGSALRPLGMIRDRRPRRPQPLSGTVNPLCARPMQPICPPRRRCASRRPLLGQSMTAMARKIMRHITRRNPPTCRPAHTRPSILRPPAQPPLSGARIIRAHPPHGWVRKPNCAKLRR